ncbi:MAG: HAD family hydrolase [Lentisphaeria bacterium]
MISFLNPGAGNLTSVHLASLAATPATARKAFFALDFDGVICDSAAETGASAWKAAERFWPGRFPSPAPTEYIQAFRAARPYLETGYQAIPIIKMLRDGLPPEAMATGFNERVNAIMAEIGQNKSAMVHAFGDTRDQWIKADLDDWISWHGIYPGVLEALQKVLDDGQHLRILTTKQERFVSAILSAHGVDFPADHIWGLERRKSKEDQLARLLADGDNDVYFIEDRLETLLRVEARDDLRAVRLYYADWGYGTSDHLAAARSNDRITVLSLSDFPRFLAGIA